ncbi:protocadherin-15-like, partial [Anguilla rostrata]|uniref:protocadherin-15-like n=1 Tax=Anguilla rostrata TaxID=7938 RepID=UPI0030D55DFD
CRAVYPHRSHLLSISLLFLVIITFLSSLFLLCRLKRSRGKSLALADGDGQRLASAFASRSLSVRTLPAANGASCGNQAFPSDENPCTTRNPLYQGGDTPGTSRRGRSLTRFHSPPLPSARREGGGGRAGRLWSLPVPLQRGWVCEALRRRPAPEPADWELRLLKAELRDSKDELDHARGQGSWSAEPRLTVREQARQFEQQALQDSTPRSGRDSRNSLLSRSSTGDTGGAWDLPEHLLLALGSPSSPRSSPGCGDVPPSIAMVALSNPTPPPAPRPTPPVLRKFSSSICSYVTVEPGQVRVEILPDLPAPETPPPLPPPPPLPSPQSLQAPPPPSLSPSPTPAPKTPPPSHPSSRLCHRRTTWPPPPHSSCRRCPRTCPSGRSLCAPCPPSPRPEAPRTEPKGVLRNLQNLSDIERSVANMYGQIDRNKTPPPGVQKPHASAEDDAPPPRPSTQPAHPNPSMHCTLEEAGKRLPSQAPAH